MGILLSWLYQRRWIALASFIGLLIVLLVGPNLPYARWWTGPVVVVLIALICYDALKRRGLLRWQPAAIALWIGLLIAGFWAALARLPAEAPGDLAAAALFVVLGTAGVMAILIPALWRARRRSRTDGGGC